MDPNLPTPPGKGSYFYCQVMDPNLPNPPGKGSYPPHQEKDPTLPTRKMILLSLPGNGS